MQLATSREEAALAAQAADAVSQELKERLTAAEKAAAEAQQRAEVAEQRGSNDQSTVDKVTSHFILCLPVLLYIL